MQHGLLPRVWFSSVQALGDCRHRVSCPGTMPGCDHRLVVGGLTGDSLVPKLPICQHQQHLLDKHCSARCRLPTSHTNVRCFRLLLKRHLEDEPTRCCRPHHQGSPPLWRVLPASLLSRCAEVEGVTPTTTSGGGVDGGKRSGNGSPHPDVKGTKCTRKASHAGTLHEGGCTTTQVN